MSAGFAAPWRCLDSGRCDFALNMAIDEALLECAGAGGIPVLRFYGWEQSAASFGYFQKIGDIERVTALRPLVRRPTGGGLVPHDRDWTYSVAVPPAHPWYELRASESYAWMHRWIQAAFARINLPTTLAPSSRKEIAGQCFAGHEQHDLLWLGRKIAGAAQRRTKSGLLIQGSVQPPAALAAEADRDAWHQAMRDVARDDWNASVTPWVLPPAVSAVAQQLRQEKYSQESYNRRR